MFHALYTLNACVSFHVRAASLKYESVVRCDMSEKTEGYRVRHPLRPSLFVWYVDLHSKPDGPMGKTGAAEIHFAEIRAPMRKEDADKLATACGGTVEPCGPVYEWAMGG